MLYLVTGAAGFIGFHVAQKLLEQGHQVLGIDNLNDYYDVALKESRLALLHNFKHFQFRQVDIADRSKMSAIFDDNAFNIVIHLAAQAGVRYSLENPYSYIDSNIMGHMTILEGCRHSKSIKHLVYASSSSVYGMNKQMPFKTSDAVEHPVSLYAATKKSNELMSHTYSHLYDIPTTGLRFFTVYGPWGRPDMAPIKFANAISSGKPIDVYNHGDMSRDFTFIDDIVDGILLAADKPPKGTENWTVEGGPASHSSAPYRIYNIGNGKPVALMEFIKALENELGIEAEKNFMEMQPGDVHKTWADVSDLSEDVGYQSKIAVAEGVKRFVSWYKSYYS